MSEHKEPIPSMIYNAAVGGHVTNSQQIIDENENKEQSQINAEVKQIIGQGGSVDKRISDAVNIEKTRAQAVEQLLQEQYNSLTQSDIVVGTLPESGTKNLIYRVPGTSSYFDYMWNGTQFVKMAEYNNAIDDEPTAESYNLVKSGGVISYAEKAIFSTTGKFNKLFKEFYLENINFDVTKVTSIYIDKADNRGDGIYRDTICLKIESTEVFIWYKDFDSQEDALSYIKDNKIYEFNSGNSMCYCLMDLSSLSNGRTTFDVVLKETIKRIEVNPSIELYIKSTLGLFDNFILNCIFKECYIDNNFDIDSVNSVYFYKLDNRGNGIYRNGFALRDSNNDDIAVGYKNYDSYETAQQALVNSIIHLENSYFIINWDKIYNGLNIIAKPTIRVKTLDYNPSINLLIKISDLNAKRALCDFIVGEFNIHHWSSDSIAGCPDNLVSQYISKWKNVFSKFLNTDILVIDEWREYFDRGNTIKAYDELLKQIFPYKYRDSGSSERAIFCKYPFTAFEYKIWGWQNFAVLNINNVRICVCLWYNSNIRTAQDRMTDYATLISYIETLNVDKVVIAGDFNNDAGEEELSIFTNAGYTLGNCGYWGNLDTCETSTTEFKAIDNIIAKGFIFKDFSVGEEKVVSDHYPTKGSLLF